MHVSPPKQINIDRSMTPDRRCTLVSNYLSQVTSHKLEFQLPNTIYIYIYTSHILRCNFPPQTAQAVFLTKTSLKNEATVMKPPRPLSKAAHNVSTSPQAAATAVSRRVDLHWTSQGLGTSHVTCGGLQLSCDSYYKGVTKKNYKEKNQKNHI